MGLNHDRVRRLETYLPPSAFVILAIMLALTVRSCAGAYNITQTSYDGWRQSCEQAGGVSFDRDLCLSKEALISVPKD